MRHIKMIVSDLDRTLLRKDKCISEYSKSVINKCYQNGIMIVFATARPERATSHLQMDSVLSYVIANNGATIISHGICIQNIPIPQKVHHELLAQFVTNSNINGMTVEVGGFVYTNDKEHKKWSSDADWNPVITDFFKPINEEVCKIAVECASSETILSITNHYPEVYVLPNNGENWQLIMHYTSSKFNAISYLSSLTGIAVEDIISFGDDYNDVEMLQKCGVGVAVENAVDDAKTAADFICDTNDNDGVARFIDKYILCSE